METVPMEWRAYYVVPAGTEINCDYMEGRLKIDKWHSVESDKMRLLQKFCVSFKKSEKNNKKNRKKTKQEKHWETIKLLAEIAVNNSGRFHLEQDDNYDRLEVIAVKQKGDQWLFLCSSKNLYIRLVEGFEGAFIYKKESERVNGLSREARQFSEEAVKKYDGKREFLRFIIRMLDEKYYYEEFPMFRSDAEEKKITATYQHLGLPYDVTHGDVGQDACFVIEWVDFKNLYEKMELLKPEHIHIVRDRIRKENERAQSERKKKLEEERVKAEMKSIASIYGETFDQKETGLNMYANSIKEEMIANQALEVQTEMERWKKWIHGGLVEKEWGKQYIEILSEKLRLLEDNYYKSVNRLLEHQYGSLADKKVELLEQMGAIKSINFNDGVKLYQGYCSTGKALENQLKDALFRGEALQLPQYIEFYHLGSVLISDQLNRVNKNPLKRRPILKEDLENAMMFFYETDTPQKAEQLRKKKNYLENKKAGKIGEDEVAYALKVLDKGYIVVPKKPNKKYGQESIVLCNPDFIDEEQEYDHIVIGKQGVFVIETKNYAGELVIDANGNWIRIRRDGTREGERNPIQQLRRHEKLLKSILSPEIPVIGLVCMAHPKMIIEGVENFPAPLVKSDLLVEYIEKYPINGKGLSGCEVKECFETIERYMVSYK